MLNSTSFLIKSGSHFRTNRNVNKIEKKKKKNGMSKYRYDLRWDTLSIM